MIAADTLFVRVTFVDDTRADYVILGTMPMVDFCAAVVARHGAAVRKCDFLDDVARPAVAEVLTTQEA